MMETFLLGLVIVAVLGGVGVCVFMEAKKKWEKLSYDVWHITIK